MGDEKKLLEAAQRALADGRDPRQVDASIRARSGGRYSNVAELRAGIAKGGAGDPREEALLRLNASRGNALTDFLRMMGQGGTMGFGDEALGDRQRVEDLRALSPGASMMAELAGSVLLSAAGAAKGAAWLAPKIGAIKGATVAGGAAGALGAGVYGAGEAEGGVGERLRAGAGAAPLGGILGGTVSGGLQAGRAALSGGRAALSGTSPKGVLTKALTEAGVDLDDVPGQVAAMGSDAIVTDLAPHRLGREARAARDFASSLDAPGGPIEALSRRAQERGERTALALREASGLNRTFDESLAAAEDHLKAVRQKMYKPLEDAFPEVQGEAVAAVLQDPTVQRLVRKRAPQAALRQGAGPMRGMEFPPERGPSFRELQDVMMDLRDEANAAMVSGRPNASREAMDLYRSLREAMTADIPGFDQAQAAYSAALRRIEGHAQGQKSINKDPREILKALADLPDDEARDAFRLGMLDKFELNLRERVGGGAEANALLNAGPTELARLRAVAGGDPEFARLLQDLGRERQYQMTWSMLSGGSPTAQRAMDALNQQANIPLSKQQVLREIVARLVGFSPDERRQAAEQIGRALLGNGEEAARLLADELTYLKAASGRAAAAGAAVGAASGGPVGR